MKEADALVLLKKYIAGTCTKEELATLENWYLQWNDQDMDFTESELMQLRDEMWKVMPQAATAETVAPARIETTEVSARTETTRRSLWPRIAAAAAVLLIAGVGLFFYTSRHPELVSGPAAYASNDIKPGSNKAYLTLTNGKRLSLTDAANGELAKEAGVEITKTADGQVIYAPRHPEFSSGSRTSYSNALNTIETPRGGQYQIRLPDGSKVWLNAASKLIYPVSFTGRGQRVVELSGEAYFEIFKNKLQPFVVKSKNQEVTVLGTHFNINTYTDEPSTKTTLLEGSVQVSDRHPEFISGSPPMQVLKPGQQAILTNNKINIVPADLVETMAWQKGDFVFKNEALESIMRKICRWYNVEVIYVGKIDTKQTFSGQVSRSKNISEVLKALEASGTLKFKIEGRKIRITN